MFGLVYALTKIAATVFTSSKAAIEEHKAIQEGYKAKEQGNNLANVYSDRLGHLRDLDTRESVMIDNISKEANGEDAYLRNKYGEPVRNLSEEKREKEYKEAQANRDLRRTVCEWKGPWSTSYVGINGRPYYSGIQYKDLDNGRIYVCRLFKFPKELNIIGSGNYYMDVRTGLLVRETDSQKVNRQNGKYTVSEEDNQKFIDYFNGKQNSTGYIGNSKNPEKLDWDGTEPEMLKNVRMQMFYCNDNRSVDVL